MFKFEDISKVVDLHNAGKSSKEIAVEVNMTNEDVETILKAMDLVANSDLIKSLKGE